MNLLKANLLFVYPCYYLKPPSSNYWGLGGNQTRRWLGFHQLQWDILNFRLVQPPAYPEGRILLQYWVHHPHKHIHPTFFYVDKYLINFLALVDLFCIIPR